jgi:TetR/AcrR family transcriptional repressor of nem operon
MLLEPAWRDVTDPIEKIFSLLGHYRQLIVETDCLYGCPIGSLALEIHEPEAPVRELLAAYFLVWTDAVYQCLIEADRWLPSDLDRLGLAEFVLTTMEGAVMQARTFRDVAYFDRAVQQLRNYVEILLYGRPQSPVSRSASPCSGRGSGDERIKRTEGRAVSSIVALAGP